MVEVEVALGHAVDVVGVVVGVIAGSVEQDALVLVRFLARDCISFSS